MFTLCYILSPRIGERDSKFRDSTNDLPVKRGFSNTQDGINQAGLHDTIGENEITKMDFIPLQIKAIGGKGGVAF